MGTNPILDELAGLSPAAQQALLQAHQASGGVQTPPAGAAGAPAAAAAPLRPPQAAGPMLAPQIKPVPKPADPGPAPEVGGGNLQPMAASPTPMLSGPGAAPTVTPMQPGTIAGDQHKLTADLGRGTGVSQIMGKVEGAMPNHPVLGKVLGGAAQGLATLGDVGLGAVAPKVATLLPGTTLNHRAELNTDRKQLAADVENAQKQAQTANTQATTAHTEAETTGLPGEQKDRHDLTGAQVENLESESYARDHPQAEYEVHDTVNGPLIVNKKTGVGQHLSVDGQPVGPKIQTKVVPLQIGGKDHQVLVNDTDGTVIRDLGVGGIKPPTVNVNQGEAALDRETKQFGAYHQKSLDAANAQLEKIADARAMINGNAEAQGLGVPKVLTALVGGQGTGVRITQAELTSIAHARGLTGDIEGTLNKWAGQGALSKTQQQQLTQIMDDVAARIRQKQSIAVQALDTINGARDRDTIIGADKAARKQLMDLETGGGPKPGDVENGYRFKGGDPSNQKNWEKQ